MKNLDVADRAIGYGIPGEIVDGQDVVEVYMAVQRAVHRARRGDRPSLIECKTYHFRGHSESHDPDDNRPKDELAYWRSRCPVEIYKNNLKQDGRITEDEMNLIDSKINSEIEEAVKKVKNTPDVNPTLE
jgi:pyruvate dehydrogenase E1 component alpha subunit